MDQTEPGRSDDSTAALVPPSPPRRVAWWAFLLVFGVAAVAGSLLYRRISGASKASPTAAGPSPTALIASVPIRLSPKAAMIADRFNCLCGECGDTLGACTCTRDSGSNTMKLTLNRIVEEKKTIPEIEAAMVAKYGPKVLASSGRSGAVPPRK